MSQVHRSHLSSYHPTNMVSIFDNLLENVVNQPNYSLRNIEDIDFHPHLSEIDELCKKIRDSCLQAPCLLNVSGGVFICGDIHGQFRDLLLLFKHGKTPSKTNQYLFLGDYVDRGKQSLETILFLYYLKEKYPGYVHLLRGNHESASITKIYGFYDECKRRLPQRGIKVWKTITDSFNALPIAALVGGKIFCTHGGLSPELHDLSQINMVMRPTDILETGIMCDLLWSDPNPDQDGWEINERGVSYKFGRDVVEDFCNQFEIDLICRAHQVVEDGYEFFADKKLVTIFSAPNYGGDFTNAAAMVFVSEDLTCSIVKMSYSSPTTATNDRSGLAPKKIVEGRTGNKAIGNNNSSLSSKATIKAPVSHTTNAISSRSSSEYHYHQHGTSSTYYNASHYSDVAFY